MSNEQQGAIVPAQQPQQGAIVPAQPAARAAVSLGIRGLAPVDLDGLARVATYVAKSGLAPKGMQTMEACFVAMEMGLELGLPLMASLQNIAVVNGRPTLWGDSQLAVVRSTGELEEFSEWYEQGGKRLARNPSTFDDGTAAVCRVKRRGMEAMESAFSVADAKRAGLWAREGTWSQYPARMMRFRARSFALRDQFGDALRGLLSTEEAQDIPVEVKPTAPVRTFRAPVATVAPVVVAEAEPAAATQPTPQDDGDVAPVQPARATGGGGGLRSGVSDSNATGRGVTDPERVFEAATTSAPVETEAHKAIAAAIAAAGKSFDDFLAWAIANQYPGASDWTGVVDIPASTAEKLAKASKGLTTALKGGAQ